jgi:phage terminase small subunit
MNNKLTQKQENFALNIFSGMPQREAYLKAGFSSRQTLPSIDVRACELAKSSKVLVRLAELRAEAKNDKIADYQERQEILSEIARGRLGDFIDTDGEMVKVDSESLKSAALQELKTTHFVGGKDGRASEKTTTVKLHNPTTAIDLLNKMDKIYSEAPQGGNTYNDIKVMIVRERPKEITDGNRDED